MSTTPGTTTVSEVSKISPTIPAAVATSAKPAQASATVPATAASANTAPATARVAAPEGATTPPSAVTSAYVATRAAVPLTAAPAAAGCCQGGSAEKTATVHVHSAKDSVASATPGQCSLGAGDALKSLVQDLKSPDAARRLTAATALGRLKNHEAAAPLIAALSDSDADVAYAAAAGLGNIGDRSAVEPLIAVVNNADGYFHNVVRTAGTVSLGQLRDLRAVEPLQNAIKDPMADTSAQAIRALAALGDPRGIAPLLEVVRNTDGFFLQMARHAAILGLAKLGGSQADCELRFVASNQFEDDAIRDAAIGAIGGTPAPVGAN